MPLRHAAPRRRPWESAPLVAVIQSGLRCTHAARRRPREWSVTIITDIAGLFRSRILPKAFGYWGSAILRTKAFARPPRRVKQRTNTRRSGPSWRQTPSGTCCWGDFNDGNDAARAITEATLSRIRRTSTGSRNAVDGVGRYFHRPRHRARSPLITKVPAMRSEVIALQKAAPRRAQVYRKPVAHPLGLKDAGITRDAWTWQSCDQTVQRRIDKNICVAPRATHNHGWPDHYRMISTIMRTKACARRGG